MTTIKYELVKPKKDKTRSISLILSHKGERKRIPTNIVIAEEDLYRNGKIKSHKVLKAINEKINILRGKLCDFEIESKNNKCDINIFLSYLYNSNETPEDFFEYTKYWIEKSTNKGKGNYKIMLNSLKRFWKSDTLLFSNIDYKFLEDYKKYLDGHPRAQSLYLGCIRHIFNEAIREYNTDANTKISNNPFKSFKIPKDIPKTKDRVVNEVDLVLNSATL